MGECVESGSECLIRAWQLFCNNFCLRHPDLSPVRTNRSPGLEVWTQFTWNLIYFVFKPRVRFWGAMTCRASNGARRRSPCVRGVCSISFRAYFAPVGEIPKIKKKLKGVDFLFFYFSGHFNLLLVVWGNCQNSKRRFISKRHHHDPSQSLQT